MSSTQIHPKHERPTPDNIDEWDEDQLEAYKETRESELLESVREKSQDLSEEQKQALDALTESVPDTETVDLGLGDGTEVRTYANEAIENKLNYIRNNQDLDAIRSELCEAMEWFIEDEQYADAEVWREFARIRGIGELKQKFLITVRPYLERANDDEAVRKFRPDR